MIGKCVREEGAKREVNEKRDWRRRHKDSEEMILSKTDGIETTKKRKHVPATESSNFLKNGTKMK